MELKLSLLHSIHFEVNSFTAMNNSLLESELQDICTFRQIIVNSNQKIHHHLLRKKCPIQLLQHCDCTDTNYNVDPQFDCKYDQKTTDYFSESDYQLNPTINGFYQTHPKDHYLTNYLNQYETNRLEFQLGPLRERKDIQNRYQNYTTPISSRKRAQFKPVEAAVFQNVYLQRRQSIRNNSKVQKKGFDENVNANRIQYDDFVKDDDRLYLEQKNTEKWNKTSFIPNMSMMVLQSQRKFLRTPRTENPLVSTQKKLSQSKNKNISTGKQTRKKSVQKKNLNQVSLRIMRRIQLSFVANKSAEDSYLAVYKKELRERSQIIDKIMSQHKELYKTQNRSTSIKK